VPQIESILKGHGFTVPQALDKCRALGPREVRCVLTEEDKQWLNERLEKLGTIVLAEFRNCSSPAPRQDLRVEEAGGASD
jgi:hypothetical protein